MGVHTKHCETLLFAQEERDSFSKLLIGGGFTDAWRRQYPEITGYTYWNYRFNTRTSNKGWRLDYCLVGHCTLIFCAWYYEAVMHAYVQILLSIRCHRESGMS